MNAAEQQLMSLVLVALNALPTVRREDIASRIEVLRPAAALLDGGNAIDVDLVQRELEARLAVEQDVSVTMESGEGHQPWLRARSPEITWAFWNRYERHLRENEGLPPAVIDRIGETSSKALGLLEDPTRPGPWDRRGLVVGQVQSGKTGNYAGLICRAADAGYKVIIVLAGLHNSLRSQTQLRLDEGFVGLDTQKRLELLGNRNPNTSAIAIGAGKLLGEVVPSVHSLTTSAERGDFTTKVADQYTRTLGNEPVLFVVKKHGKILLKLREWLQSAGGRGSDLRISDPLLLIDDEADNASIDTKASDPDTDPSKINGAIRELLRSFDRAAYVGYTATPFANIFIDKSTDTERFGADLFPRSFIEYLRPPTNYLGPVRLFGLNDEQEPLPLTTTIDDYADWMPGKHKAIWRPPVANFPESLRAAIRRFILVRAARLERGQVDKHNSMLVHVTRFQSVQQLVAEQVRDELGRIRQAIRHGKGAGITREIEALRHEWDAMAAVSDRLGAPVHAWETIEVRLEEAVEPISVMAINGTSKDALAYWENREQGLNVIAIGGDKLSRGLTLEGLTVSYYLRAAGTYDTLLQMGRWFGYRPGYEDLCRLVTTRALQSAYREVTAANEELVRDFEQMAALGETPETYGLAVKNSPNGLHITAANKRGTNQRVRVSYSGQPAESVSIFCDAVNGARNLAATETFLRRVGPPERDPSAKPPGHRYREVPGGEVADFLRGFATPPRAWRVNSALIARYIDGRLAENELTSWTVVLLSNRQAFSPVREIAGQQVGLFSRGLDKGPDEHKQLSELIWSIKRILNPPDEYAFDFSEDERGLATARTREIWVPRKDGQKAPEVPSGSVIRSFRPADRGLLLLYPLNPPGSDEVTESVRKQLTTDPMIGFYFSFPRSEGAAPSVEYTVNGTYLDELMRVDDE